MNSEGAAPSKVMKKLTDLGFIAVRGVYDFIYEHESQDIDESELGSKIIEIANALHKALSGLKVLYTLDTTTKEDADDIIPLDHIDAELEATRKELDELEKK
jgi:hypothetical protein